MFDPGSWLSLVPFVAVCLIAGGIGSLYTNRSVRTWYPVLIKPEWHPPDWVFVPVCTTLSIMMAVSAWLVWRKNGWGDARYALCLFAIQLLLNVGWSAVFFGMRRIGEAYAEILFLLTMIIATATAFLHFSLLAAWLMIPYLSWVGFTSYLNYRIWQMN